MGTSHVLSPRWVSGDIALGTVQSEGGRWSVLTWLQAKWAESPEASDPWKEKWGKVGGAAGARGAGACRLHHPGRMGAHPEDGHRDG